MSAKKYVFFSPPSMLSGVQQELFDIIRPKYHVLSNRVGTDGARINCESEGEHTM